MPWDDMTNWNDTTVWSDTDELDNVTATATDVPNVQQRRSKIIKDFTAPVPVAILYASAVTEDTELTNIIPAESYIDNIILVESAGNTGQLSAGITAAGTELFQQEGITASTGTVVNVGKYIASDSSIYIHDGSTDDVWNSMELTIYVIYFKL